MCFALLSDAGIWLHNVVRFLHFWPTANFFSQNFLSFGVTGRASSYQIGSNTDVGLNYLTIAYDYLGEKNPIWSNFARTGEMSAQNLHVRFWIQNIVQMVSHHDDDVPRTTNSVTDTTSMACSRHVLLSQLGNE